MARRRPYPIPLDAFTDHPDFETLPAVGAGMLLRLINWYWKTGCQPPPSADYDLRNICRAHPAPWRRLKPVVIGIFEAGMTEANAYRKIRDRKGTTLSLAGQKGNSKRCLQALQNQSTVTPMVTIPHKSYQSAPHPHSASGKRRKVLTDRR